MRQWIVIALVAFLASCGESKQAAKVEPVAMQSDLAKIRELPDFMFLERAGRPLARKDMLGKVWIAVFIFTRCPSHCVWMTQEMQKLQKEFASAKDFRMVSTTVDPTWDTPKVLTRFAMDYGADTDRWFFITGDGDDIREFAVEGCMVPWAEDEPLAHSTRFTLVDRDGFVRGSYELRAEGRMAKLRKDIRALLDEKTP